MESERTIVEKLADNGSNLLFEMSRCLMGKYYEAYSTVMTEFDSDRGHNMDKEAWKVSLSLKTFHTMNVSMN